MSVGYSKRKSFLSSRQREPIPGLRIRPLRPEDAQELSYLELEIFPSPWSESSLRSCLELSNVEGEAAVIDDATVGYMFVQYAYDEAHILNLGVREKFRGQGIGKLLLERFLERAKKRGAKISFLEVRMGNRVAQKLYFDRGFAPLTIRKKYYPNGEDALILVKHF